MKVYVSRRNEEVTGKLIKENEKFKTVELELLTGEKAGSIISITSSTLKRWWKVIESEDVTEVAMKQDKEPEIEVPVINSEDAKVMNTESELTDEAYAKIGLEIVEQAKKKAISHKKSSRLKAYVDSRFVLSISDVVDGLSNFSVHPYPSSPNYLKISLNGKGIGEVDVCRKGLTVYVNKSYHSLAQEGGKEMSNSYQYKLEYNESTLDKLVNLF